MVIRTAEKTARRQVIDDPRWGVVERLIASPAFAKSGRLTQFLQFVCSKALSGHPDDINELQVGIHVFGRAATYNPAEDSIVRSHARLLRRRLEEYFEGEGRGEPWRIVIPKGCYVPVFEETLPAPSADAVIPEEIPSDPGPAPAPRPTHEARFRYVAAAFVLAAVCITAGLVWLAMHPDADVYAVRFWNEVCSSSRPTIVVPSDTSLVTFQMVTGRNVQLRDYLSHDYRRDAALAQNPSVDVAAGRIELPYTNMADLRFCWALARSSTINLDRTIVRSPKDLRMDDLQGSNVILIGARRANPWVELFDQSNNFQGLHDTRGDYVANHSPTGSEASFYVERNGSGPPQSYAVISFVPGLNAADRVLMIGGTTSAGTDAGLEFVLDASSFGSLLRTISDGSRSIPWFEVLLRTRNLNHRGPGRAEVVAFRRRPR